MSVIEKLTEGIVERDLSGEGAALLNKWENTGLLEGLTSSQSKNYMSRLLENQAKELLREASSMAGADVEGFASVAFPIVRRVFGNLIANELVSVQPMSLPSGLIFFLDFKLDKTRGGGVADKSVYGGGTLGQQITGGLANAALTEASGGFYNLNNSYSSPTGSQSLNAIRTGTQLSASVAPGSMNEVSLKAIRHDPDLVAASTTKCQQLRIAITSFRDEINLENLTQIVFTPTTAGHLSGANQVRRLTTLSGNNLDIMFSGMSANIGAANIAGTLSYPLVDNFNAGPRAIGSVVGAAEWGLENDGNIPEININVDSIAVTAVTKKLKAKWTPELGQDLNAYHNLDAEVELTNVLSEHIALELDQEILNDLINGATASTYYWSRRPGKFLNRETGLQISTSANESLLGADFTGTVSEWYETLLETINDVSAQIHRKTLRGGANFIVVSPEAANLLEFTAGFKAKVTHDDDKGTTGAVNVGSLSGKLEVYVDPYFPRNVVLVGRKGSSFLESGYVYAPYVPLQVTPTIFGPEDFVPRKGVMTRYAKKMVRPDMYGLVIISDMQG
jgi:hypothetical protein